MLSTEDRVLALVFSPLSLKLDHNQPQGHGDVRSENILSDYSTLSGC
jgi:hypothetical protein